MAQFTGMDVQAVRTLAIQMRTTVEQIEASVRTLSTQLQGAAWVGTDREQFVGDWEGTLTTQLRNVLAAVGEAARMADQNANDQEATSLR